MSRGWGNQKSISANASLFRARKIAFLSKEKNRESDVAKKRGDEQRNLSNNKNNKKKTKKKNKKKNAPKMWPPPRPKQKARSWFIFWKEKQLGVTTKSNDDDQEDPVAADFKIRGTAVGYLTDENNHDADIDNDGNKSN
eukprot:jgi/Bigna1/141867/aug1.65_g16575